MSETKELIEDLKCAVKNPGFYLEDSTIDGGFEWTKPMKDALTQIKDILEQQEILEATNKELQKQIDALLKYGKRRMEQQPQPEEELVEEIRGAVARGWCAEVNEHKIMDVDLAEAIVEEIRKLLKGEE